MEQKSKMSIKLFAFVMSLLMLLVSLPISAFASAISDTFDDNETSTSDNLVGETIKKDVIVLEEDETLRDENIKHFKLSDGTVKAVSYAQPVHYMDEDGNLIDIDNALILNGNEYIAKNKQEIKFANKSGSTGLISIKDGEYKIDFTPLNANKVSVEIENPQENSSRKFDDVKKLNNLVSYATYKNIYDGIDLEYVLVGNNIKENIIVNEKQSEYTYSFEIKLNKLNAELVNNAVILTDSTTGEQMYEIPAPYMLDASGEYSGDVEYTLTQNGKWKYTLTVTANPEWINDKERQLPVKIDPTFSATTGTISDSTLYPNGNTISDMPFLTVSNEYTSYVNISLLPTLPKDAYLTDATLSLKCIGANDGLYIGVYGSNMTNLCDYNYITSRTIETEDENGNIITEKVYGEDGWISWNIYDTVNTWYNNGTTSGRFIIKLLEGTGEADFSSKEAGNNVGPMFEVSYRDMKGVESYWSYLTQSAGFAGTGAVNLATGNLMFEISTLTTTENIFGYTPSLIYNSAIAGEDYKYGSVQNGYWYSFAATGFKLNMNETLIKKSYINGSGDNSYYYVWADADGTEHYFLQSSKENEENIYYDEDGLQLKLVVDLVDDNEKTYCKIVDSGFNERIFYILGGAPASEGLAVYHLEQLKDNNGNILRFIMDGAHKPNDIKLTPSGTNQTTQLLGPLYNSSGKVGLIWCNETKEGVLFRHSNTPTGELNPTGGTYLREALYLKCDSNISWSNVLNEFMADTDNQADGITVCASAKYEYDSQGRLVSVYNTLSEYTLMYFYDEVGRVEEILEIGDETGEAINGAGQSVQISYFAGYTEVKTSGSDDVMGTDDDLINVYVFDNQGRAVTTYTTNAQRTEVYGAVSGEYVTDNENAKNSLKSTVSTGKVSPNYLLNGNFELSQTELAYWEIEGDVAYTPNKTVDEHSVEWDDEHPGLRVKGNETTSISQTVSLYPGDYTFSLDLITYASKNLTIKLKAIAQDVSDEEHIEQIAVNETFASGSNNFASLSFKVEGTKGIRRPYKIVVSVTANSDVVEESVLVDNIMLSKTSGAQEYSWVSNGSFDQVYTALDSGAGVWNSQTYSTIVNNNDEFDNYLKISGNVLEERKVSQAAYKASDKTLLDFDFTEGSIGRCAETTFILSGFGKATEAMKNDKSKFAIVAEIVRDGDTITKELVFNPSAEGWQFVTGTITVPQYSFVKEINVYCVYSNNIGEAYFDNIKLEICDYKTPRVVEYSYYEDIGKIMAEKHGYDMVYYSYNEHGELKDVIAENSYTEYEYDENHNVETVRQYEFEGQLPYKSDYQTAFAAIEQIKELVLTTSYQYDQYGLLVNTTSTNAKDSSTLTTSASYNTSVTSKIFGALETTTDALGNVTRYFYNQSNGRLICEIGADNTGYYYTYDNVGNLISVQPATYSNAPSAVTGTTEIEYEYNEKYQLEKIVANGTEYNITYDIFGNQSSVSIGENQIVGHEYNSYNGKLSKVTYANGTTISYEYDKLERIEKITCTNGETSYSYEYTYDSNGNVTKFVDGKNQKAIKYNYDLLGRLVKTVSYDTEELINDYAIQYKYSEDNMLSSIWYTSDYTYGTTLSDVLMYNYGFAYSDENDAITVMGISFSDNEIAEITYNYDSWDRLTTKNIAFSGTTNTVSYTYNEQSMLVTQYTTSVGTASKTYKYTYDDANVNITEVRDANNNLLQKYTYDSLDRLIREDNSQAGKTFVFTYDNNGNILSEKVYEYTTGNLDSVTPTSTRTYGYSNSTWKDQLTSYNGNTITYDSMGNPLTYWDGTLFTWDIEGNLTSLNKGDTSVSYKYNSAGIRTEKTVNGVTHYYTLDGTKILSEEYGNVLIVYLYDEADAPIGMAYRENSYAQGVFDVYLFTKNLQGDIIGIYDESGSLVAEYKYDAWGRSYGMSYYPESKYIADANPFRYRGYYYDTETGFYYLNSRYYDPQIKRFISADSLGYLGANGDLNSYNLYAYCSNNPVMYVDPNGESAILAGIILTVVIIAAAVLLSGCEKSSPPPDYKENNSPCHNCYSYAFDLSEGGDPGDFSKGNKMYDEKPIYDVDEIVDFVKRDMEKLGKDVRIVDSPQERLEGEYIVALKTSSYIVPEIGVADYHFAVLLSDGTWADKTGQGPSRWNEIDGMAVSWDAIAYGKGNGYYNSETRYFAIRG